MQIRSLRINNFYSFKDAFVDLTKYSGIVRITGENLDSTGSNGAGKSSIFEGIVWGLFGKTIRKSTEEALVNSKFNSNCFVELELHKPSVGDIRIYRSKRPTSLILEVNGDNVSKENSVETQKYIEQLLESDYKSFLAAIVFGQHTDISFLECSPEEKRSIIRNCFNLDDLFTKRNIVKELKSAYTAELKVLSTIYNSTKTELDEAAKKLPSNKYKYIELPSLNDILQAERKVVALKQQTASLTEEISKKKKEIQKLNQGINKGVFEEPSECPICKSNYLTSQTEDQLNHLIVERDNLECSLSSLIEQSNSLSKELESAKPKFSSLEWAKYNEKNNLILQAQANIDKHDELDRKAKSLSSQINSLEKRIDVMKFWEKAFSEQGMIKYVIRTILDYFNLKCNEFLSLLTGNQFKIEFTDELIESISVNGVDTKYISLSGGEKKRVNLSIMLALQDLSSKISKVNCNLIIFDEVSDNIDNLGIEAIHSLLNTFKIQYPDKVVLLITHNNYLTSLFSESQEIKVIKQKGISRLHGN